MATLYVRRILWKELDDKNPKVADGLVDGCLHMPGRGITNIYIFVTCYKDGTIPDWKKVKVWNLHTLIERNNVKIVSV